MKIAVISQGDPSNRAGFFNNVHERLRHLIGKNQIDVDVYLLYYSREVVNRHSDHVIIDGVYYNVFFIRITILRYLAAFKFRLIPFPGYFAIRKYVDKFKDYDLLSVHSIGGMQIGEMVKAKYGIPYVITWHGSDVHTNPYRNLKLMRLSKSVMDNADMNFFVSKALMKASNTISDTNNKEVLYSGVSEYFREYDENERIVLRRKYKVENKRVVAYLGNVISIKNVLSLPDIFKLVEKNTHESVQFWIIGDGNLSGKLKKSLDYIGVDYKMWGMQNPRDIPDFLNCVDVLVLPSFNEGLPLVTQEALKCGVSVVGSDVGGISEVIGKQNVFDLGDQFIYNIASRVSEILHNKEKPHPLSDIFNWDNCVRREIDCYDQIIKK